MIIGAEVRTFNFVLRNNRYILGLTQKQLGVLAGVSTQFVSEVETLKMPTGKIETIRNRLNKISIAMEADFVTMFPQEYLDALQQEKLPRRKKPFVWVREIRLDELPENNYHLIENIEDAYADTELKNNVLPKLIESKLQTLSDVENKVIKTRFGIDCENARTLRDIANEYGVSPGRIRQIESEALRKLRHPLRSNALREYKEDFSYPGINQ